MTPNVPPPTARPGRADAFMPKLVLVLREGYGLHALRADAVAGLTVAVVALPLSMAIAIASGVSPAQGLATAIVGGFLVSALGGSRHQIGGPAGAFIVLVAATVAQHGVAGLVLATFLSGLMLIVAGWLRLGNLVKFIPFPVTVGFTAGIAVIIAASQISELFGLTLLHEPGPLLEKLPALWAALPGFSPAALGLAVGTVVTILALRRVRPNWPGMLIAVVGASALTAVLALPVATIGTRFGGIPAGLPAPQLPDLSWPLVVAVLPAALSFTLLGAIESLLSAVVADGMTGRRHRSNAELVAQGVANVGASLFGGFCVTGTIARTATNVRAGAHSPVAGMLHSLFLLAFMVLAAPLATYIPLAALAGVLAVVAWNMVEKPAIAVLLRSGWGEAAVLAVTFVLTIFRDLTQAILAGFLLACVLFVLRISRTTAISAERPPQSATPSDSTARATPPGVAIHQISGALFFGAAASVGATLDQIGARHRVLILDLAAMTLIDTTGANLLERLAARARAQGTALYLAGALPEVRRLLDLHHLHGVTHTPTVDAALLACEAGHPPA